MRGPDKSLLIVDIDNTILNNDRRKQAILWEKLGKKIGLDEIRQDYNLTSILSNENSAREFWRAFFSSEYLGLDEPVPSAASVLSEFSKKFDITYVTGRHDDKAGNDSMKDATLESLQKYAFPVKPPRVEFYFKDKRETLDLDFKKRAIQSLLARRIVAWAIGDTPDDIRLYGILGLRSIGICTSYFNREQLISNVPKPPLIATNWTEVRKLISSDEGKPVSQSQVVA